jgi:hypothetical protein
MLLPFVREIFAEVEQLPAFTRVASHLRESAGRIRVTGLSPAAKALIVVLLRRTVERPFVLVVADNRAAEELLPVLRAFCELTERRIPTRSSIFRRAMCFPFRICRRIRRFRKNAPPLCGRSLPAAPRSSFRR